MSTLTVPDLLMKISEPLKGLYTVQSAQLVLVRSGFELWHLHSPPIPASATHVLRLKTVCFSVCNSGWHLLSLRIHYPIKKEELLAI